MTKAETENQPQAQSFSIARSVYFGWPPGFPVGLASQQSIASSEIQNEILPLCFKGGTLQAIVKSAGNGKILYRPTGLIGKKAKSKDRTAEPQRRGDTEA